MEHLPQIAEIRLIGLFRVVAPIVYEEITGASPPSTQMVSSA